MKKYNKPLVSVVIPSYNHELFVEDCIKSIIDQTYMNVELIIIDDGSLDNSVGKIKLMIDDCEKRFSRFEFRMNSNKGLSSTLNEAMEWCIGKYYCVIASDDLMLYNKMEIQVQYLEENKNCVAVFGGVYLINENNNLMGERLGNSRIYTFKDIILNEHDLPASTQMLVLDKVREVGCYRENIIIEDWFMWLKLSKNGEIHYVSQYLSKYRLHPKNISKNNNIMNQGRIEVLSEYVDDPLYELARKRIKWIYLMSLRFTSLKFLFYFIFFSLNSPIFGRIQT